MKGINFPITIKFYDILFEVNEKTLSNFIQKSDDFESLGEDFEEAKKYLNDYSNK